MLSNIYLDQLDKFITQTLGYKHYGRYVDDFYLVVTKEELPRAQKDMELVRRYIRRLALKINEKKTHVRISRDGVPFLGVVVYPGRTVPGKRVMANFYMAARRFTMGLTKVESIISYLGYMKNIRGRKAAARVFHKVGWKYRF